MKRTFIISITFLLVCSIGGFFLLNTAGCTANAGKATIADTAALRTAILKTMEPPFSKADTLILAPAAIGIQPGEAGPVYIDTKFEQPLYTDSLSKKLGLKVITKSDFITQMISAPENGNLHCSYSENMLDGCMQHKIIASIWAEKAVSTGNILVHERYFLGDSLKSVVKEFYTTENGNWAYKINESSVNTSKKDR